MLLFKLSAFKELIKKYYSIFKVIWKDRKQLESLPRTADETEFLPAHLELCEKPVSSLPKWSARLIILFLIFTLLWAYLGKVEVVTVAHGKIIASNRSKNIQPLETAIIKNIYVKNGEKVTQHQPLIELTATGIDTDLSQSKAHLATLLLSSLRLNALLYSIEQEKLPTLTYEKNDVYSSEEVIQEQEFANSQYLAWKAEKQRLAVQIEQKQAEKKTIIDIISTLSDIKNYEKERTDDLYTLYRKKSASKHEYFQQKNKLLEIENNLITQKNRLNEIEKEIIQSIQEYQAFINSFKRDLLNDLKNTYNNLSQAELEWEKTKQRQGFMILRSPIDGVVQQLQTYTIGGVATAAQTLMIIAPEKDQLEVEATISNQDIGFIQPGQDVILKIAAFPYTRYGYITGKVKHISLDAIQDEKLGFVFSTTISMDKNYLNINDSRAYLKQGMLVSAEIKTDKRNIMDYFLSPFKTTIDESLRER